MCNRLFDWCMCIVTCCWEFQQMFVQTIVSIPNNIKLIILRPVILWYYSESTRQKRISKNNGQKMMLNKDVIKLAYSFSILLSLFSTILRRSKLSLHWHNAPLRLSNICHTKLTLSPWIQPPKLPRFNSRCVTVLLGRALFGLPIP